MTDMASSARQAVPEPDQAVPVPEPGIMGSAMSRNLAAKG
jgi:hypothetical protein